MLALERLETELDALATPPGASVLCGEKSEREERDDGSATIGAEAGGDDEAPDALSALP